MARPSEPVVQWIDMLAWPYDPHEADCWALAREVRCRVGLTTPDGGLTTTSWQKAEPPWQIGDLFCSDPSIRGYVSHVEVYVGGGRVLSTSAEAGPYCVPLSRARREMGVYR